MSARNSILLVDAATKSLRVLEVSLRKVGFDVRTADSAATAIQSALSSPPDLVITDTRLPDHDGFELCQRIRRDPRIHHAALMFLSADASPQLKLRGIDVGADEFLTKPVLVKEILSRIGSLLERRSTSGMGAAGTLSGALSNMGVVDLLQVMEAGAKTGAARLNTDIVRSGGFVEGEREEAVVFFRDGRVIDAQVNRLRGAEAIYRLMLWEDGTFEVQFGPVEREDTVGMSSQDLMLEGLQRVDLWSSVLKEMPSVQSRLRIDLELATRRRGMPPREVQDLMARFDGRRSLFEAIAGATLPEVQALRIVQAIAEQGAFQTADEAAADVEALEAWLATSESAPVERDLPSALEQAVIPSPQTPSEILAAADPASSPFPLNRQTVPASFVGPIPSRSPGSAPPSVRPQLTRHRVSTTQSTTAQAPYASPPPPGWDSAPPAPAFAPSGVPAPAPAPATTGWPEVQAPVAPQWPANQAHGGWPAPTAPAVSATTGWPAPAPAAPPGPPASPAASPDTQATWDLGPRTGRMGGSAAPYAAADPGTAASPWSESSASVQSQAAAMPPTPGTYRPSETSTFKDEFFKEAASAGAPVWLVALMVLAVGGALVFLISTQFEAEEGEAETAEVTEESSESPEELARQAMEGSLPVTATVAQTQPDAGPPDAIDAGVGAALAGAAPEAKPDAGAPPARRKRSYQALPRRVRREEPQDDLYVAAAPKPRSRQARAEARSLVKEAEALLNNEDYDSAEARYRRALELDDGSAAAHSGLAFVYAERSQDGQAKDFATKALDLDRKQALAHLVLGQIAIQANDRDQAQKSYEAYLRLAPRGRHADAVRKSLETLR